MWFVCRCWDKLRLRFPFERNRPRGHGVQYLRNIWRRPGGDFAHSSSSMEVVGTCEMKAQFYRGAHAYGVGAVF